MTTLWFDCETFSECDLRTHSTHRYAEHPSTEITVAQWAIDDGEPVVEDLTGPRRVPSDALYLALANAGCVVAHNSHFDRTMIRHCWGMEVPVHRWRDTMVKALAHGLPGGLDKVGHALGIEADKAKDKRGADLIQLFCKPRPKTHKLRRATRDTHPKEWAEFLEYSRQDIIAMREVDRRLPSWNYRDGHPELALWHLDQQINDRGFAVDLELAGAAITAVAAEQARLKHEVQEATNNLVSAPSKRDQLLAFILAEYGVTLPDMKADTLRRRVDDPDLPDGVRLLLSLRLEATKTSTAKYKALVNAASADDRLRNTLQFAGAQRTARWAGRVFQPQNLPRPTPDFDEEQQDMGIAALKGGFASEVFGDVMQLTSNAIRGCIVAPAGRKLCVADLSNIEGRGLAFLAGEHWKLKAFAEYDVIETVEGEWIAQHEYDRLALLGQQPTLALDKKGERIHRGHDLYKLAYARAFGIDPADVQKLMRQIGKVMELGLGYEGGVAAFLAFAAVYGLDLDELTDAVYANAPAEAIEKAQSMLEWFKEKRLGRVGLDDRMWVALEALVLMWREAHPASKALWAAAKDGVAQAIEHPGRIFGIGKHLKARRDAAWLRIRLPSGRYLCYLHPEVKRDPLDGRVQEISYVGVDQYTRQWKRIKTYGGKLIENCTQAFARDVMAYNMPRIQEQAGYPIVLSVHDELLTEPEDSEAFNSDKLSALLANVPPWAQGIPLAAAGFQTYRYRKD